MLNSVASINNKNHTNIDTTRPYVQIKVLEQHLTGLLDTGSCVSILGNESHEQLLGWGFILQETNSVQFTTASGEVIRSIGIIPVPITFQNQTHIIKAYVVPSIKNNLILGIDFWKTFGLFPKYLNSIFSEKLEIPSLLILYHNLQYVPTSI